MGAEHRRTVERELLHDGAQHAYAPKLGGRQVEEVFRQDDEIGTLAIFSQHLSSSFSYTTEFLLIQNRLLIEKIFHSMFTGKEDPVKRRKRFE